MSTALTKILLLLFYYSRTCLAQFSIATSSASSTAGGVAVAFSGGFAGGYGGFGDFDGWQQQQNGYFPPQQRPGMRHPSPMPWGGGGGWNGGGGGWNGRGNRYPPPGWGGARPNPPGWGGGRPGWGNWGGRRQPQPPGWNNNNGYQQTGWGEGSDSTQSGWGDGNGQQPPNGRGDGNEQQPPNGWIDDNGPQPPNGNGNEQKPPNGWGSEPQLGWDDNNGSFQQPPNNGNEVSNPQPTLIPTVPVPSTQPTEDTLISGKNPPPLIYSPTPPPGQGDLLIVGTHRPPLVPYTTPNYSSSRSIELSEQRHIIFPTSSQELQMEQIDVRRRRFVK